jgi:hypothetical protein
MNQTDYPSLGNAVAGVVFHKQPPSVKSQVDEKAREIACIDLTSKLENIVAKTNEMATDDFIDESAVIGRKIIEALSSFIGQFLEGKAAQQANEEIDRAKTFCLTYDEVLNTRSFGKAILRTFWKIEESDAIKDAHGQLGTALTRACAVTFYHAVVLFGDDSKPGELIDQSALVFVNELKRIWKLK